MIQMDVFFLGRPTLRFALFHAGGNIILVGLESRVGGDRDYWYFDIASKVCTSIDLYFQSFPKFQESYKNPLSDPIKIKKVLFFCKFENVKKLRKINK